MDLTPYYGFEEDARHFHRACRDALAPFGDDTVPALQGLVRRVLLPEAPQRAARHRRHLLRRLHRSSASSSGFAMLRAVGDAFLAAYLPIVERRRATAVRRARARLPGLPARPLRRVQPGVGPRHAVRPAVGRPHREHPDVDAAAGDAGATTGSPSPARPRRALYTRLPASARLGRDADRRIRSASASSAAASIRPHNAHVALARARARRSWRSTSCAGCRPARPWHKAARAARRPPTAWRWCGWRSTASRASSIDARELDRARPQLHGRHLRELHAGAARRRAGC